MMPAKQMKQGWSLSELLAGIAEVPPQHDVTISGICADSREVCEGDLFLAVKGTQVHGLRYLDQALARGAVAVAWETDELQQQSAESSAVPLVAVDELTQQLGYIADRFYRHPSHAMSAIAVTGTDGKTSVSQFVAQALHDDAHQCGVIGTLGYGVYGDLTSGIHTTPDAIRLQAELDVLRAHNAAYVSIEASSHGLDQGRLNGVALDIAVFTNLSRDHFDYHGSEQAYADAKRRLFLIPGIRHAVINLDDDFGYELAQSLPGNIDVIGYGQGKRCAAHHNPVTASQLELSSQGVCFTVTSPRGRGEVQSRLLARFNVNNLLAALGVMLALDMPFEDALARLSRIKTVAGRMEAFGGGDKPLVVVDYAHTPAALTHVLTALREHCEGELWCVFGCGGDRDKGKRPLMARAVERCADHIIVTDDNPRSEDPQGIVNDILAGFSTPGVEQVLHDRGEAITQAISRTRRGDVVLVAGKGHEAVQIVGAEPRPFSDRGLVRELVGELQ